MHPLIPENSFPPARNDTCYCGSNIRFKHCCGDISEPRKPPHGIEIIEGFLSPQECSEVITLAQSKEDMPFQARHPITGEVSLDSTRVCSRVQMGEHQNILDNLVARAFEQEIIPRSDQPIEWYEEPQLLHYLAGGFYYYHCDNAYLVPRENAWRKAVDRDISLLIYLTDDFEGGELHFKRLNYSLKPKAGMLVWFPSDMRFEHMAKPVTRGNRLAIVSWAAAKGVERVQDERALRAIDWTSREKKQANK